MENEVCCPRPMPELWNDNVLEWNNKKFIKGNVKTFMFMPLDFGKEMTRLMKLVEDSDAKLEDNLCLSVHSSKWNMNIFLAVDKDIPGAENTSITGNFYSKVYEGPFNKTGEWMKDFEQRLKEKGYNSNIKDVYMWYTTCPKCAKKYGKNYVVVLVEIK